MDIVDKCAVTGPPVNTEKAETVRALGWQRFEKDMLMEKQSKSMVTNIFKENEANCEYFLLCAMLIKLGMRLGCDCSQKCPLCVSASNGPCGLPRFLQLSLNRFSPFHFSCYKEKYCLDSLTIDPDATGWGSFLSLLFFGKWSKFSVPRFPPL